MATIFSDYDLSAIGFGKPLTNKGGGKNVLMYYQDPKTRVEFQLGELGDTAHGSKASRVAFPPESNKFDSSKTESAPRSVSAGLAETRNTVFQGRPGKLKHETQQRT